MLYRIIFIVYSFNSKRRFVVCAKLIVGRLAYNCIQNGSRFLLSFLVKVVNLRMHSFTVVNGVENHLMCKIRI